MSERRKFFLHLASIMPTCFLGLLASRLRAAAPPKVLTEQDRIPIGPQGKTIIEKAYALGRQYHSQYGGCSQTSLAALQDSVPFVPKDEMVFLAATPLSGGATRSRNASCGAFTGCGLAIGSVCGRSRDRFASKVVLPGQLILELSDRFVETWGGVLCNDIRPKVNGQCAEVVGRAAAWTAEILLRHFTDFKG